MPNTKPTAAPAEDGLATAISLLEDRFGAVSDRVALLDDRLTPVLTTDWPEPSKLTATMPGPDKSPLTRKVDGLIERASNLETYLVKLSERVNL